MSVDLHLGDGIAGLARLDDHAVDVTITDPPFDARTHRAALELGNWREGKRSTKGALPFPPLSDDDIRAIGLDLARVTRRWILVMCAERQIETWAAALESGGARFVRLGEAYRTNPKPQQTADRPGPSFDPIVIAHGTGEAMRWNGRGRPARWDSPAARFDPGGQQHPTQKPLALIRALVDDFTDAGELVLDPFAGAGTAAVACREMGRRFVGWEISPGYHSTALARVGAAREQLRLDVGPPAEQLGLALAGVA